MNNIDGTANKNDTWQSVEQDTSQVSVTSLPEDDRSEPSITISSTINDNDTIVQQKGNLIIIRLIFL